MIDKNITFRRIIFSIFLLLFHICYQRWVSAERHILHWATPIPTLLTSHPPTPILVWPHTLMLYKKIKPSISSNDSSQTSSRCKWGTKLFCNKSQPQRNKIVFWKQRIPVLRKNSWTKFNRRDQTFNSWKMNKIKLV